MTNLTATGLTIKTASNTIRLTTEDSRIARVEHHTVFCSSQEAAESVARELRAWGIEASTFEALVML